MLTAFTFVSVNEQKCRQYSFSESVNEILRALTFVSANVDKKIDWFKFSTSYFYPPEQVTNWQFCSVQWAR
jgi:hypothetical protein